MTALMDLDLNCCPPSPEPAAQEDFKRAMLRQEHTFRDQVKDLHRLYWAQKNLTDVPIWKQSDDVLYARHSLHGSHMMDLDDRENLAVSSGFYELGNQALRCGDEVAGNLGSVRRKPDPGGVQRRSDYHGVIDLEKPATLDDDCMEIVSSAVVIDYANHNGGFSDNSQRLLLENTPHVSSGSTRSSDTPDSHSPVKAKSTASGRMFIDLNIAQEDDFNVCPDPSKAFCPLLPSSNTVQSGDCCNNSSKAFHKGSESSIESSKGSSITVVTSISAPDSSREVMAAGFRDPQSHQPFCVGASKHDALLRGNIQHQHTLDKVCGLGSQDCLEIPREVFSVRFNGGKKNSSGLHKSEDNHTTSLIGEPAVVHREHQEETLTVISDNDLEVIDLNMSVGSIDLPSTIVGSFREKRVNNDGGEENSSSHYYFTQNESRQNTPSVDYPTIRNHHMAESMDGKSVQSPDSGIAINRSILIPETPEGRDYACPRLRSSNNGASNFLDTIKMHQAETEEDEKIASTAAETLLSIFTNNSAWIADSHCSNNQTDAQDGSHEPQLSLDSFEEGVLHLEEIEDDGESIPVRSPDKDGPSCGIKLKRGRGLRDFQREILPGLVSLARHEICDDLHAIGYELRKTRSRRTSGDQCPPPTRTRLPRRCSTAWNQ